MDYGKPWIPAHGVYETYFKLYPFKFDAADQVGPYNVQENAGKFADFESGAGLYYAAFPVDTTGLSDAYSIHFDLFNAKVNAPFSHDAQSDPPSPPASVPEPAGLLLLGLGIAGIAGWARRFKK